MQRRWTTRGRPPSKGHSAVDTRLLEYLVKISVKHKIDPNNFFKKNLTITQTVNIIDIVPTILDILNIPIPDPVHGISLLPALKGQELPDRSLYFESRYAAEVMGCAPVVGVLRNGFKFIQLPKPELYDLKKDPYEQHNLWDDKNSRDLKITLLKKLLNETINNQSRFPKPQGHA